MSHARYHYCYIRLNCTSWNITGQKNVISHFNCVFWCKQGMRSLVGTACVCYIISLTRANLTSSAQFLVLTDSIKKLIIPLSSFHRVWTHFGMRLGAQRISNSGARRRKVRHCGVLLQRNGV